jgi:chromosome partitioning protein
MKAKVITIANQKGGVAKTTTAVNLAYYLSRCAGKKTLLVDVDPQTNATKSFKGKSYGEATLYDLLLEEGPLDEAAVSEAIQHTEVGDVLPGDKLLKEADDRLHDLPDRYMALKKVLDKVMEYTSYEYIVVDTNPSLNTLLQCALSASDFIVMPCEPDMDAVEGLSDLSETIYRTKAERNPGLIGTGILAVKVPAAGNVYKVIISQMPSVAQKMGAVCFKSNIRLAAAVAESKLNRLPVIAYRPASNPALDYIEFGKELVEILERKKEA